MIEIIVIGGILLTSGISIIKNRLKENKVHNTNIRMYQKEKGLTDSELNLLRETLGEVKSLILSWEKTNIGIKDLNIVEAQESGIKSAKEIFQELMENPKKLNQLNEFLYIKLPGVVDASKRVRKIRESGLSTPEIEESVKSMVHTIRVISASITDDYEAIVQEDSEEIALTKKIIGEK
ncbi:hypothetical protein IGI37_003378 [Enterococcus sp. AZ194]|uniref:5-bromo-4-chloroindolyl phosphate hydrolysis family protein n=1 Tax=Enterococcus sp. AZ194 TaxID=2774629 RepID=UPI003F27EBF0